MTAVKLAAEARVAASATMRVSISRSFTFLPAMDCTKNTSQPRTVSSKRA
jgi:hypothetical protein